MNQYRFQVNLGGMIDILSDHLYSSPDTYIRELLQNGVDAITGYHKYINNITKNEKNTDGFVEEQTGTVAERKKVSQESGILLEIREGEMLVFSDNGQGLTEEEIHRFLAIIGESSKRNTSDYGKEEDYIGRFGIGLLSCFMVSDEITMITKSCTSPDAPVLEWRGKPDGTYTIRQCEKEEFLESHGTKVILHAKGGMEEYFSKERIEKLVVYYGMLLPVPVMIRQGEEEKQINPIFLPWEGHNPNQQELLVFGQWLFGQQFFDCIPFYCETGKVSGSIYILNYPVQPSARHNHRIYLKHMLLTEKGDSLIPDWAVFTRCVMNAMELRPTASREGFYVDEVLKEVREAIEKAIVDYIVNLAERDLGRFQLFFNIHNLTLRSLALDSMVVFETLIDYFDFETTRGILTGYDLRMLKEPLVYAPTKEKYEQLSQLFFAQNKMLINVSYVHSLELLQRMQSLYGLELRQVDDWNIGDLLEDLSVEDADRGFEFLRNAGKILKKYDCQAELKYFSPTQQPAFYLLNEATLFKRQINAARDRANSMFYQMLDTFSMEVSQSVSATLYFNYHNPVVRKMVELEDLEMLKIFVEILYVQALQIGGFPLHNNEMALLNENILKLMERGLSDV